MFNKKGTRIQNFKGGKYTVVGLAKHTETEEELIVYQSDNEDGELHARPVSMFSEIVERDGRSQPRFTIIE